MCIGLESSNWRELDAQIEAERARSRLSGPWRAASDAATRPARIGSTISRISLMPITDFTSLPSTKKFGVPMTPSVRPRSLTR